VPARDQVVDQQRGLARGVLASINWRVPYSLASLRG
jgi:hypothetical protein